MSNSNINRRDFLKLTAVGVAVAASTRAIQGTIVFRIEDTTCLRVNI